MYFCILVMKKYIVVILLIFTVLCPETGGAQVVDSTSRERKMFLWRRGDGSADGENVPRPRDMSRDMWNIRGSIHGRPS